MKACKNCSSPLEKIAQTGELLRAEENEAIYTKYYQCGGCGSIYEVLIRDSWYRKQQETKEVSIKPYEGTLTANELKAKAKNILGFITSEEENHLIGR